ncbi:NFX1-type zinc finger-containing protein 1-like [Phlebotomus papatasi]|uniref:NFX1-type zinc finger-containing protein 1-like n=1 Tax=Phlebotomus papatasi TaxID=29031 RepID=UPI002483F8BB|nr:NFX1-type zinc finger-containing protein 1-like [Phlebotomus papatasi]
MNNSDDSDDWFSKDVEDFKAPVKKKQGKVVKKVEKFEENEQDDATEESSKATSSLGPSGFMEDYGGSYNVKVPSKDVKKNSSKNSGTKSKASGDSSKGCTQKMSNSQLLKMVKEDQMSPLDVFFDIMINVESFKENALEEDKSHQTIIFLIVILGKLHQVPLNYHLEHLMGEILKPDDVLSNDILSYVKYIVELEEKKKPNLLPFSDQVWRNLEIICNYGMRFQGKILYWLYFTESICEILEGKTEESLQEKYLEFLKIKDDLKKNYFFPKSIYPNLRDLYVKDELPVPNIINGKFENANEYLAFHLSHLRSYFTSKLYDGMQEFWKIRPNIESSVILKNVNGINIFPRVKMYKSFPKIMAFNDKYFVIDLAPYNRDRSRRVPEDIREEITSRDLALTSGALLFLSPSAAFGRLIVCEIPYLPTEIQREGFLFVDIVKIEVIEESILGRDLFLVTIPIFFEAIHQNLKALEKISTATLPMKEYFVDCESSAILPDYENLEENALSLEKINLRAEEYRTEDLKTLGMNERQFEAFQLALTRKLSLIQGPPGTGKSTVALNIVQRLLANTSLRILIVTFTNFALDKLLLKCSKFTDKIVRIGINLVDKEIRKFILDRSIVDPRHSKINGKSFGHYSEAMTKFVDTMNDWDNKEDPECDIVVNFENLRLATLKQNQMSTLRMYYGCRDARIIGMTTTGAAKYHEMLDLLRPSVVIIEEAAEVPETHIITSLTEFTQQLILIGDHKQLAYYNFDKNYQGIPLFERLIENGVNNVRLNIQYRMHPDIADLVRGTIYDDLSDGENVQSYRAIRGITRNLFCVTHKNLETLAKERYELLKRECPIDLGSRTSKENFYEMLFAVGLANYLRQQGYLASEIVILTTYSAQQFAIISILENFPLLMNVEVHTVDSFQGQESRIVILSLVRSNDKAVIGFLTSEHRLCVLLSRAQEGFYIVGNMEMLVKKSQAWREIKQKLKAKGAIGQSLPLICEHHRREMSAGGLEDFLKFTRDGCPTGEQYPQSHPKSEKHPCLEIV